MSDNGLPQDVMKRVYRDEHTTYIHTQRVCTLGTVRYVIRQRRSVSAGRRIGMMIRRAVLLVVWFGAGPLLLLSWPSSRAAG